MQDERLGFVEIIRAAWPTQGFWWLSGICTILPVLIAAIVLALQHERALERQVKHLYANQMLRVIADRELSVEDPQGQWAAAVRGLAEKIGEVYPNEKFQEVVFQGYAQLYAGGMGPGTVHDAIEPLFPVLPHPGEQPYEYILGIVPQYPFLVEQFYKSFYIRWVGGDYSDIKRRKSLLLFSGIWAIFPVPEGVMAAYSRLYTTIYTNDQIRDFFGSWPSEIQHVALHGVDGVLRAPIGIQNPFTTRLFFLLLALFPAVLICWSWVMYVHRVRAAGISPGHMKVSLQNVPIVVVWLPVIVPYVLVRSMWYVIKSIAWLVLAIFRADASRVFRRDIEMRTTPRDRAQDVILGRIAMLVLKQDELEIENVDGEHDAAIAELMRQQRGLRDRLGEFSQGDDGPAGVRKEGSSDFRAQYDALRKLDPSIPEL